MFSKEQLKEIENMGIEISPKSEKVKAFSPNKFASYIADNLKIINNKDISMYIKMECGRNWMICTYSKS